MSLLLLQFVHFIMDLSKSVLFTLLRKMFHFMGFKIQVKSTSFKIKVESTRISSQ